MRLGELDIIADGNGFLFLTIKGTRSGEATVRATLDAEQAERLIVYLKGARDGLGWNNKAAADRSL